MRLLYRFLIVLLLILFTVQSESRAQVISQRNSISLEWGNWQPHSLNSEPKFTDFGAAGATPYVGLGVIFRITKEIGLGLNVGFWALKDLDKKESVPALVIHPITFSFKHWLIPGNWLSAFVVYSGGIYLGVENETDPFGDRLTKARACLGLGLGAGFDVAITKKFGLGTIFRYRYVRFRQAIGGVDDFSGPAIAVVGYYYF